jgi:HNH endonuclease
MSTSYIKADLRRLVEERAAFSCEYCPASNTVTFFPHEVDHIVAEKHNGRTVSENLAYACWRCNRFKGSDLGSFDPQTDEFSFLFHPRNQHWDEHFQVAKDYSIIGLTPEGRTTVVLLQFNQQERIQERQRQPKK